MQDLKRLLEIVHQSTSEFVRVASPVRDETAAQSPSPGSWSVLEIVEHVILTDRLFGRRIQQAEIEGEPVIDAEREHHLLANVSVRTSSAAAPTPVLPKRQYVAMAGALETFHMERARMVERIQFDANTLRLRKVVHPGLGELSAYEGYLFLAAHATRHARQIEAVQAALSSARS